MVAKARNCELGAQVGYHIGHSKLISARYCPARALIYLLFHHFCAISTQVLCYILSFSLLDTQSEVLGLWCVFFLLLVVFTLITFLCFSSSEIVFKTAGVLLDEMRDKGLNALNYKAIILDEVHERSVESDLVLVCVKQFLLKNNDLRCLLGFYHV